MFLAFDYTGRILRSTDGIAWTPGGQAPLIGLGLCTFTNGHFFIGGANGQLFSSTDGQTWTARQTGTQSSLLTVLHADGKYVLSGHEGTILTSTDLVTWTRRTSGTNARLRDLAYGNNTWVAISNVTWPNVILTSPDAVTWTERSSSLANIDLESLASDGTSLVAAGANGTILRSTDGAAWSLIASGVTHGINEVAYGSGKYIAVGDGPILSSTDGTAWSPVSTPFSAHFFSVAYVNNLFVAIGEAGAVATSADGTTWSFANLPGNPGLNRATFGAGNYVIVGDRGAIFTSANAVSWTAQPSGIVRNLFAVDFNPANSTFVATGAAGTVLTSTVSSLWPVTIVQCNDSANGGGDSEQCDHGEDETAGHARRRCHDDGIRVLSHGMILWWCVLEVR